MPELPEMENYRRLLGGLILNRPVTDTEITREKSVNVPPDRFDRLLKGQPVTAIDRRAKHLIFRLASGEALVLHLMLGGVIYCGSAADKPDRTVQVRIGFGERNLYFIGLRLGYLHVETADGLTRRFAGLGPEPFDPELTPRTFAEKLEARRGTLKSALVDQSFIAGIGNCYSDEICFDAEILPSRAPASLTPQEAERLFASMRSLLADATAHGGYMDMPLYPGDTLTGGYDRLCRVYDREGEPCVRCGSPIRRGEVSSKKSFACTVCQH